MARRSDMPMYQVKKDTSDVWWGYGTEHNTRYYYPPPEHGPASRPMVKKTIVVEKSRPGMDIFVTKEFCARLNKCFSRLEDLRDYIFCKFDPNRSGFLSLGDFLCLWFKNHRMRHHRSFAEQMRVMGKQPPRSVGYPQCAAVTAVAAALAARTLKEEQERQQIEEQPDQKERWWGVVQPGEQEPYLPGRRASAASSGGGPAMIADFRPRDQHDDGWVEMTPGLLYRLRAAFERYNENDGSNPRDCSMHIRYGLVTSFLQDLKCNGILGPFFAMTHYEMTHFLNDLVRHANESMANMRERSDDPYPAKNMAICRNELGIEDDGDIDWDPSEDDELAMHLENARRAMKEAPGTGRHARLEKALSAFHQHKISRRPPPFFEEPTYVFSCVLALLLKHMVPKDMEPSGGPGQDEVLSFFNQGIKYFHAMLGAGQGEDVPRILPIRVLLKEFAVMEIRRPGSTSFIDAHNPHFSGPREGKFRMDNLMPVRHVNGHGEIGAVGAL